MSDEPTLADRLRHWLESGAVNKEWYNPDFHQSCGDTLTEAADRITELEAENAELRARWDDEITMMDEHATAYDKGYDDALARRGRGLSR